MARNTPVTNTPVNIRGLVGEFLVEQIRGEGNPITEGLPERCRSCKPLTDLALKGTLAEVEAGVNLAKTNCPATYVYMGALVTSCALEHREEQIRQTETDRYREGWRPYKP